LPNTNLINPKTIVPQLRGTIEHGATTVVTAAMALPSGEDAEQALQHPPSVPSLEALERLIADAGVEVSAIQAPERF
jgi:hypothetical protein